MWSRVLRVVAGAVAIGLSFFAIAYPGLAFGAVVVLLSVVLLISGVELIAGGIFHYRSHRAGSNWNRCACSSPCRSCDRISAV